MSPNNKSILMQPQLSDYYHPSAQMVSVRCGGILSHRVFSVGKLHLKTVRNESDMASAEGMSFLQLTLEDSLCSFADTQGKE